MACPHVTGCPLYPLFTMESLLQIWKRNYCEGDYAQCARWKDSTAGRGVPVNLLPNGRLLEFMPPGIPPGSSGENKP